MARTMMQMQMMQQMMNQTNNPAQPSAGNPAQPDAAMSRDQVMTTLKELGELKAAGILTEDEFNEKKKDLLARL